MSTTEQDPYAPLAVIYQAIADQALGKPIDEDAVTEAVVVVAAAQLIQGGMSEEAVERQFCERDYKIRLDYDFETEELDVGVNWIDDDEAPSDPQESTR